MSTKKVSFGTTPTATKTAGPPAVDQWVDSRNSEPMKRLTLDLPASLHARIKSTCALEGVKMVDVIRSLLEERFPR